MPTLSRTGAGVSQSRIARWWRLLLELRSIARPSIWLVSLVPFYVGHLLATGQLLPAPSTAVPALIGMVVWGPLACLAVLAINDVYDVRGDLLNPRKAQMPVTSGRLPVRSAFVAAHTAAILAILIAAAIRPAFALVTFIFFVLGWLYSVPPTRLKSRPGFDVAINALGVGGLAILAGWTAVRPIDGFPWAVFVQGCLVAAALYIPTTIADHRADVASGYHTIAVVLGPRVAYRVGLGFWTVSGLSATILAATGIFPHRMMWIQAVSVPVLIWVYQRFLGDARDQKDVVQGIIKVSWAFLVPCVIFALIYTEVI